MVGAPGDAAGEARLEGHRARAIIAAERHALAADPLRVDVVARLEPVDDLARPDFCVVDGGKALEAQGLAGSRLVDHERGDAALGEPARQADAVFHLLRRIEAVELDEDRRAALHAFGADIERREMRVAIGDLDPLAILAGELHAAVEDGAHAPVEVETPGAWCACMRSQVR